MCSSLINSERLVEVLKEDKEVGYGLHTCAFTVTESVSTKVDLTSRTALLVYV